MKALQSTPVETDAWGYESANRFINVGITVDSPALPRPEALMELLLEIQEEIAPGATHRDAAGGYKDRLIDIDLIAVDDIVMDTPTLTLPHPRMRGRRFVLEPLAELWSEWRHPVSGLAATEMLRGSDVEKVAEDVEGGKNVGLGDDGVET